MLLQLDGQQVSRVVIVPMLMRIGAAVVRMDGIGGVGTEEEFRNRGYSRRVMETAVEQMRRGDAALSTLFGIEDFYQKFGYETTGPEYTVVLPLAEACGANPLPSPRVAVPAPDPRRHAGGDAALSRQYPTGHRGARPP